MKRLTYKTLMNKVDRGDAEVNAWATKEYHGTVVADVTFYTLRRIRREAVEVTKIPAEMER